jgi:hypothetical protein
MDNIKIGDIFEINTSKGKAYLHYVYKDPTIGELVRVLPGLYAKKPDDMDKLAVSEERYLIFFPLLAAFNREIVDYAGHYDLKDFTKPEYMRTGHMVRGAFLGWYIVNTSNWHRQLVKELTPEQKKLSPWGVWNDTLLIERLEQGWVLNEWG